VLNLDDGTYTSYYAHHGFLNGKVDQMQRLISPNNQDQHFLFYTKDGGKLSGIHVSHCYGHNFTMIVDSVVFDGQSSGMAFSLDGRHVYMGYQVNGTLFDITRDDGQPFYNFHSG